MHPGAKGVSWICPTYGRSPHFQHLLEERIESFLRQDYPVKELLILNDAPTQKLICRHPGVYIFNYNERLPTLGQKYNELVNLASFDLIMPAEDDDIHLPHAISQAVEQLGNKNYWKPPQVFFYQKDKQRILWKHNVGIRHHASIFTKRIWKAIKGYKAVSGPQDRYFDEAVNGGSLPIFPNGIPPKEWAYIYRWGVQRWHLSSRSDTNSFYEEIGNSPLESGTFELNPHWNEDYLQLVKEALARDE